MDFDLRPLQVSDADAICKYANNYNIARMLTNRFPFPYTLEDAKQFIAFANNDEDHTIFAITIDNDEPIGAIGIHPQKDVQIKNAELGYWIGEPFWGKGIISRAIPQIIEIGFNHYKEIDRIFARPFGSNLASQKVLEKCGFKLEARLEKTLYKFDKYEDELIFAIRR